MTLAALKRRVEYWQGILGLQAWELDVQLLDTVEGDPEKMASCEASKFYESATLRFSRAVLDTPTADQVIVHELVHVIFRDMEEAWMVATDSMPSSTADMFTDRITHEYEGVVDRLARSFVTLNRTNK